MTTGRAAITLVVAAATSALAPAVLSPDRSEAVPSQAGGCTQWDSYGQCEQQLPVPVTGGAGPASDVPQGDATEPASGSPARGRAAPLPACRWETAQIDLPEEAMRAAPDSMVNPVQQWYTCDNATGAQQIPGVRWVDAGPDAPSAPAPVPPPPAAVALMLYARVQALMEAPRLATNPPAGAPAVVGIPVFVSVGNWQGQIGDRQCVLGVCVEMTASPALEFAPGEPGASPISCEPPGSQFDAARGDARTQASVPGACAYAYQLRTGVDDRPEEWTGEVRVRWAVSWTSNVGASGTFPELTFSAPAPRVVNEVQTVVADSE